MAEAIPYGAIANVLVKLASPVYEELKLTFGVKKELEKIEDTLSLISGVLLDAEDEREKSRAVNCWIARLQKVVYRADDLLDDFATQTLKSKAGFSVRHFFSSSNQVASRLKLVHKIKKIREELDELRKDTSLLNSGRRVAVNLPFGNDWRETDSLLKSEIIGREREKEAIIELLLQPYNQQNVSFEAIVGFGGMGKTALAQWIYDEERVKKHFQQRIWVYVSEEFNLKILVKKILKGLPGVVVGDLDHLDLEQLQNCLQEKLRGKRYLLVMDDVWNKNPTSWQSLRKYLECGAEGSKILVTTRRKDVTEVMDIRSPCILEGLKMEESWALFDRVTFGGQNRVHPNLEAIGKEVVGKCKGVPLAIITLGRLLGRYTNESFWLSISQNEIWRLPQNEDDIIPVLKLCYVHLPIHLRQCFAYCSIFPKDSEIEKEKLIQLWLAQGYIQSSISGNENLEDVGDQYFSDLLSMSFFQNAKEDAFGNVISCKMHDLIHDFARLVAGNCYFMVKDDKQKVAKGVRHVSLECEPSTQLFRCWPERKGIRTINFCEWSLENELALKSAISCFKRLRALDLSNSGIKEIPNSIGNLKQLRFLDLSHNDEMEELPDSICRLCNLQTLRLSYCGLTMLPTDLKELSSLEYLMIDGCYSLMCLPEGLEKLTLLRRLPRFIICNYIRKAASLNELKGLNYLGGQLWIKGLGNVKNAELEAKEAILKEKKFLQSLSLFWWSSKTELSYTEALSEHYNECTEEEVDEESEATAANDAEDSLEEGNATENGEEVVEAAAAREADDFIAELSDFFYNDYTEEEVDEESEAPAASDAEDSEEEGNATENGEEVVEAAAAREADDSSTALSDFLLTEVRNAELLLDNLEPHPNLKTLHVEWYDGRIFPSWLSSIQNLVQISISNCKRCQHLPPLDHLPCLEILELRKMTALKYVLYSTTPKTCFPSLKELTVIDCFCFEGWKSGEAQSITSSTAELRWFPRLSKLTTRNCGMLSSMPLLPSLKNLHVEWYMGRIFPSWLSSVKNLVHISIKDCNRCQHLPPLDHLPCLEILELREMTDLKYVLYSATPTTCFPSLKELTLIDCPDLEGWKSGEAQSITSSTAELPWFPRLSKLNTCNCRMLSSMPLFPFLECSFECGISNWKLLECTLKMKIPTPSSISSPLCNLKSLSISDVAYIEFLPEGLQNLQSLTSLELCNLSALEYVSDSEQSSYPISGRAETFFFPFLEKVALRRCYLLKGWWRGEHSNAEQPWFPRLCKLEISCCPHLISMPLFPSLVEGLYLENASAKPLLETMKMTISEAPSTSSLSSPRPLCQLNYLYLKNIEDLESLPDDGLQNLNSLLHLRIERCPRLVSLGREGFRVLTSLILLHVYDCKSLKSLSAIFQHVTALKELEIMGCDEFDFSEGAEWQGLRTLSSLALVKLPKVVSLPKAFQCLTALKELCIGDCCSLRLISVSQVFQYLTALETLQIFGHEEHDLWDAGINFHGLKSLRRLTLSYFRNLETLPDSLQHTVTLEELHIYKCPNFFSLPTEIANLKSLKQLFVSYCPNLRSLPEGVSHLTSLQELLISVCPLLSKRCLKPTGVEWPKIAHIPYINTDFQMIDNGVATENDT